MVLRRLRSWWPAFLIGFFLYFFGLTYVGLLSQDEPRYASIGREMAQSGDWITPRLWGVPWFEKPALTYWLTAIAFRTGLDADLAPRIPIAIASVLFLAFYFIALRKHFGERAAAFATAILATSAGWLAYSQVGVTDLPLAAAFSAAILLALDTGTLPAVLCGVMLGLAVLAKGLVPLVLAAPLVWKRKWTEMFLIALACIAIAAPWYVLCWIRNGNIFLQEFFWKHHFERFTSAALQHVQPFWYYLWVLPLSLFPWTATLAGLFNRETVRGRERIILTGVVLWGFLFFSISRNKLPGYLLPLLPPLCALCGVRLAEMRHARVILASAALLLAAVPFIVDVLPTALVSGLSRTPFPPSHWFFLIPAALLAFECWRMDRAGSRATAVWALVIAITVLVTYIKVTVYPRLDSVASARSIWRKIESRRQFACVGDVNRAWQYGLNYYSVTPLPACTDDSKPIRIMPGIGGRAILVERSFSF